MTAYMSKEEITARQLRTAAADAKAASDPASLDDEDLKHVSQDTLTNLMNTGLPHLGIGPPRQTRRYR